MRYYYELGVVLVTGNMLVNKTYMSLPSQRLQSSVIPVILSLGQGVTKCKGFSKNKRLLRPLSIENW